MAENLFSEPTLEQNKCHVNDNKMYLFSEAADKWDCALVHAGWRKGNIGILKAQEILKPSLGIVTDYGLVQ